MSFFTPFFKRKREGPRKNRADPIFSFTDYCILINDLIRRLEDLEAIVNVLQAADYKILVFHLKAPEMVLKYRNRCRDPLDYIMQEKLEQIFTIDEKIKWPEEIVIDTTEKQPNETVQFILQYIDPHLKV